MTSPAKLSDNVERLPVEHSAPTAIIDGVDVSAAKRSWTSYLWDTWDKTPEVRRVCSGFGSYANSILRNVTCCLRQDIYSSFIRAFTDLVQLDLTLMTFGCLGTFIKYLDKYVGRRSLVQTSAT